MKMFGHYKQFWMGIGCLFASLVPGAAMGEFVRDLYIVQVPVEDQSETIRLQAFSAALKKLLPRLTGKQDVVSSEVKQAIKKPAKFVQQYQYVEIPNEEIPGPGASTLQQGLLVHFDEQGVNTLLRSYGLPLWGKERPATLVILLVEQDGVRRIVGSEERSDLVTLLKEAATDRGTPILLPLLDLSEQSALDVEKIWKGDLDSLKDFATRYDVEAILVGNAVVPVAPLLPPAKESEPTETAVSLDATKGVKPVDFQVKADKAMPAKSRQVELPEQTKIHWTYLQAETKVNWDSTNVQAIGQGFASLADRLAAQYAVANSSGVSQDVTLRIDAVPNMTAYFRIRTFLEALTLVKNLQLESIEQSSLLLRLQIRGDLEALSKSIALGRVLKRNTEAVGETAAQNEVLDEALNKAEKPVDAAPSSKVQTLSYRYIE